MGDIANMTNVHGEVDGFRLLRWLRSRQEMENEAAKHWEREEDEIVTGMCVARSRLLAEMADDLEAELTPPDYSEDDGDEPPAYMNGPHDPHKRSPGADDEGVDLDDTAMPDRPEEERKP